MNYRHTPVLLSEVLEVLQPAAGKNYIDATAGGGGHAAAILEQTGPSGRLLAIDLDPYAVSVTASRLKKYGKRAVIVHGNYADLEKIVSQSFRGVIVSGILLDLGFSSNQIDSAERGFSFRSGTSLDMRYDTTADKQAQDLLETESEEELARIFKDYGEIPYARKLAHQITKLRSHGAISRSMLIEIAGQYARRGKKTIHPATTIFQALRIAVNDELGNLRRFLPAALSTVAVGGRIAIISYHSLEDRIVKQFFSEESRSCVCPPNFPVCRCDHEARIRIISKKPIMPSDTEIEMNPRSRSAHLRVAERIT